MAFVRNNRPFSCFYLPAVVATIGILPKSGVSQATDQMRLPQAVGIHPYLYACLMLAPVCVLIILIFAHHPLPKLLQFWIMTLLFFISFDFQQVAQANYNECHYPMAQDATSRRS